MVSIEDPLVLEKSSREDHGSNGDSGKTREEKQQNKKGITVSCGVEPSPLASK